MSEVTEFESLSRNGKSPSVKSSENLASQGSFIPESPKVIVPPKVSSKIGLNDSNAWKDDDDDCMDIINCSVGYEDVNLVVKEAISLQDEKNGMPPALLCKKANVKIKKEKIVDYFSYVSTYYYWANLLFSNYHVFLNDRRKGALVEQICRKVPKNSREKRNERRDSKSLHETQTPEQGNEQSRVVEKMMPCLPAMMMIMNYSSNELGNGDDVCSTDNQGKSQRQHVYSHKDWQGNWKEV